MVLVLVTVLVMLGVFEVLLRTTDPLGIYALVTTLRITSQHMDTADPRGFGLPPGDYQFPGWSMTINDRRNRATPAAQTDACKIVFIGDSVTIGQSVQDDEVWVNLLAAEAEAEFANAAFMGFNIDHIANTLDHRQANGYVYLMIGNDASEQVPFEPQEAVGGLPGFVQNRLLRATYAYMVLLRSGSLTARGAPDEPDAPLSKGPTDAEYTRFRAVFDPIANRDDVLVLGFNGEPLIERVVIDYPSRVVTVDRFTEFVSWIDVHPNPAGNRQLAANAQGPIEAFIERICG